MLYGLIALFIITPLLGLVHSLPWIIALRTIQGLAASTFAPAVLTYIVEIYPVEKRVSAIGFVSTGFLLAGIVGQVFIGIIAENAGWQYVFYTLGGIYFIFALLLWRMVARDNVPQRQAAAIAIPKQMFTIFFIPSLRYCYVVTVTLLLSFVALYVSLGHYLLHPPFELNNNQTSWFINVK
ncbi:hypothetical protein L3i20_v208190 [Paenibacillus sp. L3-i20]|nr:hypothetical protein L3i20_v208190 [Paenibacillus sp. L3-i20]